MRTVAWVDIMEDLNGHDSENTAWTALEESPDTLKNLLEEVGKCMSLHYWPMQKP